MRQWLQESWLQSGPRVSCEAARQQATMFEVVPSVWSKHKALFLLCHSSVANGSNFLLSVEVLVSQWCPTSCNPRDCSLPGSSVHGILQARILE